MTAVSGNLRKMRTELESGKPGYFLPLGDSEIPMNALLGHRFSVKYEGLIHCIHCGRKTNKSFNQGSKAPVGSRSGRMITVCRTILFIWQTHPA